MLLLLAFLDDYLYETIILVLEFILVDKFYYPYEVWWFKWDFSAACVTGEILILDGDCAFYIEEFYVAICYKGSIRSWLLLLVV